MIKETYVLNGSMLVESGRPISDLIPILKKSQYSFFSWNGSVYFINPYAKNDNDYLFPEFKVCSTDKLI